jgi:hypothetical protein
MVQIRFALGERRRRMCATGCHTSRTSSTNHSPATSQGDQHEEVDHRNCFRMMNRVRLARTCGGQDVDGGSLYSNCLAPHDGLGIWTLARQLGCSRQPVRTALMPAEPPPYRKPQRQHAPKLEPFQAVIDQMLDDDLKNPPKQRHYSTHIHRHLIPGVWLPVPLARMSSARASWMNKSRRGVGYSLHSEGDSRQARPITRHHLWWGHPSSGVISQTLSSAKGAGEATVPALPAREKEDRRLRLL